MTRLEEHLPAWQRAVSGIWTARGPPSSALGDLAAGTHRQHSVVEGAELRRPWSSIVRVWHEVSCVCVLVAVAVAWKEVAIGAPVTERL